MSKKEMFLSPIAAFLIPFPLMITALANVYRGLLSDCSAVWIVLGAMTLFLGYIAGYAVKKTCAEKLYTKRIILVFGGAVITSGSIYAVFSLNMSTVAMTVLRQHRTISG